MKKILLLILIITLISACKSSPQLELDGKVFDIEIADDEEKRATGLMFREELCDNCGMLFVFPDEGIHAFWMKNTLIALDMIHLDKDMKVVDLIFADPCREGEECPPLPPKEASQYVLEVNQGTFDSSIIGKTAILK